MEIKVHTKCPYCGHQQINILHGVTMITNNELIRCDSDDGGCDFLYAVRWFLVPSSESSEIAAERKDFDKSIAKAMIEIANDDQHRESS